MAHINIYVTGLVGSTDSTKTKVQGIARLSGMIDEDGPVYWTVDVNANALATAINEAIKDAAIAAAEVAEYSVGGLDKKTLYGGAMGL